MRDAAWMKRGHSREAVFEWNGDAIVAVENVKINESEKQRVKSEKRQSVLNMQDTVRKMLNGASAFRKRIVKQFSGRSVFSFHLRPLFPSTRKDNPFKTTKCCQNSAQWKPYLIGSYE